jgi:uncharacterized membrane protein
VKNAKLYTIMLSISLSNSLKKWAWGFVLLLAVLFIFNNAVPYFNPKSPNYEPEKLQPFTLPVLIHIAGGIIAILTGAFQFIEAIRTKYVRWHRILGKIYLISILISALVSYYLSVFHAIIDRHYITFGIGLMGLATAWLFTSGMAFWAIKRRDFEQHREWMIRSYVVTCGFITFRLIFGILQQVLGVDKIDSGNIAAWGSWSVSLLFTEIIIQYSKISQQKIKS